MRPLASKVDVNTKPIIALDAVHNHYLLVYGWRDSLRAMSGDSFLTADVSEDYGPFYCYPRTTIAQFCTLASGSDVRCFRITKKGANTYYL